MTPGEGAAGAGRVKVKAHYQRLPLGRRAAKFSKQIPLPVKFGSGLNNR